MLNYVLITVDNVKETIGGFALHLFSRHMGSVDPLGKWIHFSKIALLIFIFIPSIYFFKLLTTNNMLHATFNRLVFPDIGEYVNSKSVYDLFDSLIILFITKNTPVRKA